MIEPELLSHFKERDVHIAGLIEHYGDLPSPRVQRPFEALTDAVISQQLSSKAAATIFDRFNTLIGYQIEPEAVLALPDDAFTAVGISRQKRAYLRALAEHFAGQPKNRKWHMFSDEEIIEELTSIKGIGVWTVQMFLIFQLLRQDVLPLDDLGIRKGMAQLYGVAGSTREQREKMKEITEPWRPYRSVACRYIWRYYGDQK